MAAKLFEEKVDELRTELTADICGADIWEAQDILFRRFLAGSEDEREMRDLVFSNAFLGQPFDTICRCKEWFCDVVLGPYIQYQRENIHVAIHRPTGRLVGYLTGSLGGQEFEALQNRMVRKRVLSLAASLTMPWTYLDFTTRLFATHVIFKGEQERPRHPQKGLHWHYQVDETFRGRGVGTRLLKRFVNDAESAQFDLIWAEVMTYPDKPHAYFEDRGWSIYDAKPTSVFGTHVDFPVEVACITRPLGSLGQELTTTRPDRTQGGGQEETAV